MAEATPPAHPPPPRPPPPRPPPSNTYQLPPHPPPAAAAPHKRTLDVEEFKLTSYYKIRAIVRDLRASFLEACRTPDLQSTKAIDEIQKKLKTIAELYRFVGTERASSRSVHTSSAFAQDSYGYRHQYQQKQQQIPSQAKADHKQKINLPSEAIQHKPDIRSTEVPSSATSQSGSGPHPLPPRSATTMATNTPLPGAMGIEHLLGAATATKGTYVIGGSPLGWNFMAYHTTAEPVYGGVSKAEWRAKRSSTAAVGTTANATSSAAAGTTVASSAATVATEK